MNFTYRQAIVLFVASMLLVMVGLLFKIQHWPNSHILIGAGLMGAVVCYVMAGCGGCEEKVRSLKISTLRIISMKTLKIFAVTFAISAPVVFLIEVFVLNYAVKASLISGLAGGIGAGIGLLVAYKWKQKQMNG